jgi:aspartokinase-like uncharacterized kinase
MNNDTAANILRSHRWKLYTSEEMGLLPDGVLRRYIDNVQHQSIDTLVSFLERFGDVSNYDADATIAWSFVAGPWVDNTPRAGNWRLRRVSVEKVDAQGRVGSDGTNWRIVQELSEGFLTALDRDDARLVESRHMSGDTATNAGGEHYITLEWVGVDPDTMHALARKKVTTADVAKLWYRRQANDGLLKRVRLEGTWHHLASQSATAEDGSGTVRWLLADPEYVLTGYSDWLGARQTLRSYYWNVPEALAQGIMNAAKAKGVSASAMRYDAERGLIDLVIDALDLTGETIADVKVGENCDATEYASFAFAGGNSAALPIPGSIPAGTSYDRNLTINGDGSYNIVLRWKVRKYRDITEYDSEFRADQGVKTKEWKGWTNQSLGTALNSQTGKVVQVRREVREDCSVDIERRVITPVNQTTTSGEVRADQASVVVENTQAAAAETTPPTRTAGELVRVQNKETEFGKFATRKETITAAAQTTTYRAESRADQTVDTVKARNAAAKADATAITGKVVRASSAENEFGRFDNTVETITPFNQTTTSGEVRADQASVVVENTQAAAAETTPPTRTAGELVRVQNKETEFGKFATRKETITAAAQTTTYLAESRADQTVDTVRARNAAAKADATAITGKVVRASSAENEFGRFDNTVETITPFNQTTTSGEVRADQASVVVENTQAAAAETTPPTRTAGELVRVQNKETEFGKFATRKETITAAAQTTTYLAESRADQTVDTVRARNAAAKADATAITGKVVRASSAENEFGRFDNTVETITPFNQTTTSGEVRADQASVVVENTQAAAAETTPPTRTAGELVRVQNKETEFGKFATRKETITAAAQTTTYLAESRADQTVDTVKARNAAAKADATAITGKVVRASSAENEFGKFDNQVDTITAAKLETGWQTFDHPDGTVGVYAGQNLSDSDLTTLKGTLTTRATAGDRTSLSPRKNEFGLWDVTASYMPESTTISIKSSDWNGYGVKVDAYPSFETENGMKNHEMKVFRCYTSSKATAESFFSGTPTGGVDPAPSGYTFVPSYRGKQSVEPRWMGANRWFAQRVVAETTYQT